MWPILQSRCAILAALVLHAACEQPPNFTAMSTRELVVLCDRHDEDETGKGARMELAQRPPEARYRELQAMLADRTFSARVEAAGQLGICLDPFKLDGDDRLDAATRADIEQSLITALEDAGFRVRLAALEDLASTWWLRRPDKVPDAATPVLLEGLRSRDPSIRDMAAFAARNTGPAIVAMLPDLIAALERESPEGPRFSLVLAISSVGVRSPEAARTLVKHLDDDDNEIRYLVVLGLGRHERLDAALLPHMFTCLHEAEPKEVRAAALTTLAKHVTKPADIKRVLSALLESRALFEEFEIDSWLDPIGRLAASVHDSGPARAAATALERELTSDDEYIQLSAAAAFARLGGARRDHALVARLLPQLASHIELFAEPGGIPPRSWAMHFGLGPMQQVLDTVVELSRWSEAGVDPTDARVVLERCTRDDRWWIRDWAKKQLSRIE